MMISVRTIIDIPDEVIESLDRLGGVEKRSRAALIREAVSEYLRVKSVLPAEAAFGLWKQKQTDGVHYQNALRNDWDDR
jgi:predicted transcriptional regulator